MATKMQEALSSYCTQFALKQKRNGNTVMIYCHVDHFMACILYNTTVAPLTPSNLLNSKANRPVNHGFTSSQSESALVLWRANFLSLFILLAFIFIFRFKKLKLMKSIVIIFLSCSFLRPHYEFCTVFFFFFIVKVHCYSNEHPPEHQYVNHGIIKSCDKLQTSK